jgi:hypothetical protein
MSKVISTWTGNESMDSQLRISHLHSGRLMYFNQHFSTVFIGGGVLSRDHLSNNLLNRSAFERRRNEINILKALDLKATFCSAGTLENYQKNF